MSDEGVIWMRRCLPHSRMTLAGRAVLEQFYDGEPRTMNEALTGAERGGILPPGSLRRRFYELLGAEALQRTARGRFHITPAGEALLQRIWGADPAAGSWPDVR